VTKLVCHVHRIDAHDDCVCTQDAVDPDELDVSVGDIELGKAISYKDDIIYA
jgi:hypothetical protein